MKDYNSRIWIYAAPSEIVRADRLVSLHVSDGGHDNRAGETNRSGVLWAYVAGRTEPVRIGGFVGITAAEILAAMADALNEAAEATMPAYVSLSSTEGPAAKTSVTLDRSFPGPS